MTIKSNESTQLFIVHREESYNLLFKLLDKLTAKRLIIFLSEILALARQHFVKYYIKHLNPSKNAYSPTFSLINEYIVSDLKIYHYDLYRLSDYRELQEIGVDYSLDSNGIHFIEWPNKFADKLPTPDIHIDFSLLSMEHFYLLIMNNRKEVFFLVGPTCTGK